MVLGALVGPRALSRRLPHLDAAGSLWVAHLGGAVSCCDTLVWGRSCLPTGNSAPLEDPRKCFQVGRLPLRPPLSTSTLSGQGAGFRKGLWGVRTAVTPKFGRPGFEWLGP